MHISGSIFCIMFYLAKSGITLLANKSNSLKSAFRRNECPHYKSSHMSTPPEQHPTFPIPSYPAKKSSHIPFVEILALNPRRSLA
jgi:hypothetical protein